MTIRQGKDGWWSAAARVGGKFFIAEGATRAQARSELISLLKSRRAMYVIN